MNATHGEIIDERHGWNDLRGPNIALFGLSANPPTIAHFKIVEHLINSNIDFDELWILPVYHHIYNSKRKFEPYDDRINMLQECVKSLPSSLKRIRVLPLERTLFETLESQGFFEKGNRMGTFDLLLFLQSCNESLKFTLVLGTDTYRDLVGNKWKSSEQILSMAKTLLIHRPGTEAWNTSIQLPSSTTMPPVFLQNEPDYYVTVPEMPNVSSTLIVSKNPAVPSDREYLKANLHPAVLSYMESRGLYGFATYKAKRRVWISVLLTVNTGFALLAIASSL